MLLLFSFLLLFHHLQALDHLEGEAHYTAFLPPVLDVDGLWLILRACSLIRLVLPSIVFLYPEEAPCIPQKGVLRPYSPECVE
jgi:hypothetical protein